MPSLYTHSPPDGHAVGFCIVPAYQGIFIMGIVLTLKFDVFRNFEIVGITGFTTGPARLHSARRAELCITHMMYAT